MLIIIWHSFSKNFFESDASNRTRVLGTRRLIVVSVCIKLFFSSLWLESEHRQFLDDMNLGPERCNPCSKSFLSKESMQIHFCKIHKNGTHHCHVCKAAYVSQNDLENHYETIHENPELHQCLICKISFINDYSLQKHIQTTKHKQSVHEEKNLENTKTDSQTIFFPEN